MGTLGRSIHAVGSWIRAAGQAVDRVGCSLQGSHLFEELGDVNSISVGSGTNIQDNALVHVAKSNISGNVFPTTIGNHVTVGHGAVLCGCTVEDEAFVGMGATLLNGAYVEKNAMVAAGALLRQNTRIPFGKAQFPLVGSRGLCTMLSSESGEGSFPSDLLSRKQILTPERTIGQLQDLVIPVRNFHNEDKGLMVLAGDVFDLPIRKDIIHRVVRWQLAKRQQGTHSTKTISEVSGTGRKPWRQKGTGRARHGSLRGPQFRHGAVMHGPKPRSHEHKLNKKVRRLGLKIALSARAAEGKLLVFDDFELPDHKTKNIVSYVSQMEDSKKLLMVDGGPIDEKLKLATQNLHYVNVLPSIGLNVYSILLHDTLVMSRDAVNKIVERMHTPINR